MARKENGFVFEVHSAPLKDKAGNNYVYVRPFRIRKRTMVEFDEYCSKNYALVPGEMTRILNIFMEASKIWQGEGDRLETPFGSFAVKLGLRKEKTTADQVHSQDVELQGIEFTATRDNINKVNFWTHGFRPLNNPDSQKLISNMTHLEKALQRSLKEKDGYVDIKTFMRNSGLTYHSASKQLNDWCKGDNPRLLKTKIGGSFIYTEI